ncbi:DUF2911 domain-containing protein [Fulvivirga sp. RKSG066]|nr:DUF2911 domain-containing protein [Fulvivirga aurantia]
MLITGLLLSYISCLSQESLNPRPSPTDITKMKHKNTYLKITYSRPQKNGREIFGNLVPYGKVWRTGANEATEITLTDTVLVAGDTLNAGTYSIFSIPQRDKWTVIFNSELGQWGAYNYLEASDVLRIEAPVEKVTDVIWEPFTIQFEPHNSKADLIFLWDRTKVKIPIDFLD